MKIKFMNPEYLKQNKSLRSNIKNILIKHYGQSKTMKLNTEFLEKYLSECIEKCDVETELNNLLDKFKDEDELQKKIITRIMNEMKTVLLDSSNYIIDLMAVIYMGLIYCDRDNDLFAKNDRIAQIKGIDNNKEDIRTVWCRDSKEGGDKKNEIRRRYPVPIKAIMNKDNEEYRIISLPGGCIEYHKTMISLENVGVYDVTSDGTNYQRYAFPKMYKIYKQLENTQIENVLLMEYTLGIGYVNQSYEYMRKIKNKDDLVELIRIPKKGAEIQPIFLRKQIMNLLWKYIQTDKQSKDILNKTLIILDKLKSLIHKVYYEVLEVWWYVYYSNRKMQDWYLIQLQLKAGCDAYYDCWKIYQDWIEQCGVHDWRNIQRVEDCFYECKDNSMLSVLYSMQMPCEDILGTKKCIIIGMPANEIGRLILEKCVDEMKSIIFPENNNELLNIYLKMRQKIFTEIRTEDYEKFYKCEVKIRENQKTVKHQHVYAYLVKNIMSVLLDDNNCWR